MEISKVYQVPEQIIVSTQSDNGQQVSEKKQVADTNVAVQKDFQVDIQDGLKTKLTEFANVLQNREKLIQSLPEAVRKAVVELLGQISAEVELPQGLENLLKGQRITAEQLKDMSQLLGFSVEINKDEHSEIKAFLQKTLEMFTKQAGITPEQSAKELVQLAKQLPMSHTVAQGNLSQALEELLELITPEKMQQLTQNGQKNLVKLTNLLGKDLPAQLQQLVQQNKVLDLPAVGTILKMADAWQFKEIQPKTLQAAADLFKQIAQEMSPEKGTAVTQLEAFVKNLPSEAGTKGAVMTQLEAFVKSLPSEVGNKSAVLAQLETFVKSLPSEVSNKSAVLAQLETFVKSLPSEVGNKSAVLAQLETFVKTLPPEVGNKGTVVTQLEGFAKTLSPEVSNKNPVLAQLEQVIRTLPPEIGKALQQALKQGNIPDNLRGLAETFRNAILLHENMSSDLQAFVVKNLEKFVTKSPSMLTEANDVVSQLAKQLADTNTTATQLKTLVQQLKTQLFGSDPKLLEKQQQVLDQITKLLEPNIPQVLQDGGVKHKLPELAKIWVLLKALGAEQWQELESQNLQKSAGVVKELAQSIYKSTALVGEKQAEHSTLSFSIPLHVADGIYYPAHIHIYHEQKDSSSQPNQREFETWLRVCVDTENIGMVDSVFRLYGDNKLDVRVNFPVVSAAQEFAQDLPAVRKSLENSKLTLTDIMVNKA